jgi:hypothetical protein
MKRIALVAAGAAVAGLTACGHSAAPAAAPANPAASPAASAGSASPAGHPASAAKSPQPAAADGGGSPAAMHSAMAVTCKQRYGTWQQGPGKGLAAALDAVGAAEAAGNNQALTAALKQVEPIIATVTRNPLPSCADPKGYWEVLLMHVNAATASKASASSQQAALRGVPTITNELTTELKHTGE